MRNYKNLMVCIICFLFVSIHIRAQYNFPAAGFVFDDSSVPRIDIEINPVFLDFILDPNNQDSNTEYPATFYFSRVGEVDTVENVGFRLRGNTSRAAGKKSFKISFNSTIPGQKYKGLDKMNLNGEHNDPAILRSKICWDLYRKVGIPGSRSNHVELYVNGSYRGLYINVEHIDEEFVDKRFSSNEGNLFKCLYPADLIYKGEDPELYKEVFFGRRAYQLQINDEEDDYSDLAHFIDVLNHPSSETFQCDLENIFDVENYLKVIAMDILVSNWDGPIVNINNFYLYHDIETNRFVYIPYDLDNTLGVGWGGILWHETDIYDWADAWGEATRPIYENLMNVPEYKDKVSYYIEQFTTDFFNNSYLDPLLDDFREHLEAYRAADTYASLDYGWDVDDFKRSFDQSVAGHVKLGLKDYIDQRHSTARNQLDLNDPLAIIEYEGFHFHEDRIDFNLKVEFPWELEGSALFYYRMDGGDWKSTEMSLNTASEFVASIDRSGNEKLEYYFEVSNFAGIKRLPYCESFSLPLSDGETDHPVINEFLASNVNDVVDGEGEHEDWVEIYNPTSSDIDLSNFYLTDKPDNPGKWKIEDMVLGSGQYLTFWADEDGEQGSNHMNFKLSKGGEFLGLFVLKDNVFFAIDTITFPAQETDVSYGRLPNGTGDFQSLPNTSFGFNNEQSSSINEWSESPGFKIYPNPAADIFHIMPSKNFTGLIKVDMYNNLGLLVFTASFKGKNGLSVPVGQLGWAAGTYIVSFRDQSGSSVMEKVLIVDP